MNRHEFWNGTNVTNTQGYPGFQTIFGIEGMPSESWYNDELQKKHFGFYTPEQFHGYNSDIELPFAFVSSDPYTYASTMLALASYIDTV